MIFKSIFKRRKKADIICYAPYNNLLIDQQGQFKICCHNNSYILGTYPNEKPLEIWFSKKRKEIIKTFELGEISDSCKSCINEQKHLRYSENKKYFLENKIKNGFKNFPMRVEYMLSNICNLNCIMCSENISNSSTNPHSIIGNQSIDFDDDFIQNMEEIFKKSKISIFSGGEPFAIPIYYKIWDRLHEVNSKSNIYIQTNATIINDKVKSTIKKHKMQIGVSIDSIDKDIYETIRKNANYEETFSNLEFFINHSKKINSTLSIMLTPMKINALGITDVLKFCNKKEIYLSYSILEFPPKLAIWAMSSTEIDEIIQNLDKYKFQANRSEVIKRNEENFHQLKELIKTYHKNKLFFEKNNNNIENEILQKGKIFKEEYKNSISNHIKAPQQRVDIESKLEKILHKSLELFSNKFSNPLFIYAYFANFGIEVIINHLLQFEEESLINFIDQKTDDLKFLLESKTYNRIIDIAI
ncbi:MAG: radical SAM protein [Bacteroidales bacterium]